MATADYIIIGGGIGGYVVASRLHQKCPSTLILIIDAGLDASKHPMSVDSVPIPVFQHSDLEWDYKTVPQKLLGHKTCTAGAGKAVGGGVLLLMLVRGWFRGDKKDYNSWGKLVDDARWSYAGILPYFRKTETHYGPDADPNDHGFEGGMCTASVTSSGHNYPLRNMVKAAWEAMGLKHVPDANSGSPQGFADVMENRKNGERQLATDAYPLAGVKVMSKILVKRIIIKQVDRRKVATGVELANGEVIIAMKEINISVGAYRTPQVLMLSGIGPSDELKKHGIEQIVDLSDVGKNLHDHLGIDQLWKLRNPENGYSLGSPLFNDPKFTLGSPVDFIATRTVPTADLKAALENDEGLLPTIAL